MMEQLYLFFIYILLVELAVVTLVAMALFIALVVIIRKHEKQKNTSLLEMYLLNL